MPLEGVALAHAIGENAYKYRYAAGLTLDQVSRAARARGLKWSESRVADFEAGRVASPSLNTLLAVVLALNDAGCQDATLHGLVAYIAPLKINDTLELLDGDIVRLLKGQRVERAMDADDVAPPELPWKRNTYDRKITHAIEMTDLKRYTRILKAQGATEERVSKKLKIAPSTLAHLTAALWKQSFSEERDRRAGEGANAQKRGQISRAMQSELIAVIDGALRGDRN